MPQRHWLDEPIATLTKEGVRWRTANGDKAVSHDLAAALLSRVAAGGATEDEVKAHLALPIESTGEAASAEEGAGPFPDWPGRATG